MALYSSRDLCLSLARWLMQSVISQVRSRHALVYLRTSSTASKILNSLATPSATKKRRSRSLFSVRARWIETKSMLVSNLQTSNLWRSSVSTSRCDLRGDMHWRKFASVSSRSWILSNLPQKSALNVIMKVSLEKCVRHCQASSDLKQWVSWCTILSKATSSPTQIHQKTNKSQLKTLTKASTMMTTKKVILMERIPLKLTTKRRRRKSPRKMKRSIISRRKRIWQRLRKLQKSVKFTLKSSWIYQQTVVFQGMFSRRSSCTFLIKLARRQSSWRKLTTRVPALM